MIIPDYSREEELYRRGYARIAGVDEAGRGPLAGPVAAAAVVLRRDPELIAELVAKGLRDSKKMTAKRREELYGLISIYAQSWKVEMVSPGEIDELNILVATKLAMCRALFGLVPKPTVVIVDGNTLVDGLDIDQIAVPKADEHIVSVSAAAVMAKVTRDRLMDELDARYPEYGFARHKGYGTREHVEILARLGPSPVHRLSFEPIKSMRESRR